MFPITTKSRYLLNIIILYKRSIFIYFIKHCLLLIFKNIPSSYFVKNCIHFR